MLTKEEYKKIYDDVVVLMSEEDSITNLQTAIKKLNEIPNDVIDVSSNLKECKERLAIYEKYFLAKNMSYQNVIEELDKAIALFNECLSYKDSAKLKEECESKKKDLIRLEEEEKEKNYCEGKALFETNEINNIEEAIEKIRYIRDYKDSDLLYRLWNDRRKELIYKRADTYLMEKTYESLEKAIADLNKIKGYKSADSILRQAQMDRDSFVIDEIEKRKWNKLIILCSFALVLCLFLIIVSLVQG